LVDFIWYTTLGLGQSIGIIKGARSVSRLLFRSSVSFACFFFFKEFSVFLKCIFQVYSFQLNNS